MYKRIFMIKLSNDSFVNSKIVITIEKAAIPVINPWGTYFNVLQTGENLSRMRGNKVVLKSDLRDFQVIYQIRETVFHWGIQTSRIELKIWRATE